jgi:hypothetical protein
VFEHAAATDARTANHTSAFRIGFPSVTDRTQEPSTRLLKRSLLARAS